MRHWLRTRRYVVLEQILLPLWGVTLHLRQIVTPSSRGRASGMGTFPCGLTEDKRGEEPRNFSGEMRPRFWPLLFWDSNFQWIEMVPVKVHHQEKIPKGPKKSLSWEKGESDNMGPMWGHIYSTNDENSDRLLWDFYPKWFCWPGSVCLPCK